MDRQVVVGLALTDASGKVIQESDLGTCHALAWPKVSILDANGMVVHAGTIDANVLSSRVHLWQVPRDLTGTFIVRLSYEDPPVSVVTKDVPFTVGDDGH